MVDKIIENMNRRDTLKALALAPIAGSAIMCKDVAISPENATMAHDEIAKTIATVGSYNTKFLTSHEFESVSALVDVIIPKDEVSGSASDAKVPEWIDWNGWLHETAKTPLRGGIAWMDRQCRRRYDADFKDCTPEQQTAFVEDLAFPDHIAEDLGNFGKDYFNMMRNYSISGFYSSKMGHDDVKFMGNGYLDKFEVPKEWLDHLGVSYDDLGIDLDKFA